MNICFLTSIRAFVLIVVINVILPWTLNQMSKSTSIIRTMCRWSQKRYFFWKRGKTEMHISFCIHSCVTFLWKVFDLPIFAHLWISISCEVVTCCAYKCRWDRTKQWEILQSFAASCELIRIHRANLEPIHIHLGRFVGMTAASLRVSWCPECRLVWKKMRASAESSYQRIKMKALAWTLENWNAIVNIIC